MDVTPPLPDHSSKRLIQVCSRLQKNQISGFSKSNSRAGLSRISIPKPWLPMPCLQAGSCRGLIFLCVYDFFVCKGMQMA